MTTFQTIAILLSFAALGSYINKRFLKLPTSVGIMLLTLLMSWVAMACSSLGLINLEPASAFVSNIDFSSIVLHGMLSFILFAGALHVDLAELRRYRSVVALLATVGVGIATIVTGTLIWATAHYVNFDMPYLESLLFGALISPTDPVAVLSILKNANVGKGLRVKISAESLLNDGVGVVIFLIMLALTSGTSSTDNITWQDIVGLILWQGLGSIALGLALGWMTFKLLSGLDDYKTEILLTLALASGGYALAEAVSVSAPIAMVIAGLVIGNHGRAFVMSDKTREHLDMFWELVDDILNTILFALIGLEIMIIPITMPLLIVGVIAIIATLVGRFVSVALPINLLRRHLRFERGSIRLMTWGGLRGGISIAMALSVPPSPYKNMILGMTYLTVVFSVLFQGTSFGYVVKKVLKKPSAI